jgi:hypothetical protein
MLEGIYNSENVLSLEIIRFGSYAVKPVTYVKGVQELLEIKANLRSTDFNEAMKVLLETLKKKSQSQEKWFVIFLSDGEASHPTGFYAPVSEELKRLDAPMLSLAISSDVNPEIMVNLANLHGKLGLCLVKDNFTDEESINAISEFIPTGKPVEELVVTLKKSSGEVINTLNFKYARGTEVVSTEINDLTVDDQIVVNGELEGQVYTLRLANIEDEKRLDNRIEMISDFVVKATKAIIGDFLVKKIQAEETKQKVLTLKNLFE